MNPLTIGILSWQDHPTLQQTLTSYQHAGLLNLPNQIFIYFQAITPEDEQIAKQFNLPFYGSPTNLGIAGGYREMLNHVQHPYYLFLENDWVIRDENFTHINSQIKNAISYLADQSTDVIRLRSRRQPGEPLYSRKFQGHELSRPEHLLDCLHWTDHPDQKFPEYINKIVPHWYRTSAHFANWTNNPHMLKTDWAKEILLPHLGQRDIEKDLQKWWQTTDYQVTQGTGLFTHHRL